MAKRNSIFFVFIFCCLFSIGSVKASSIAENTIFGYENSRVENNVSRFSTSAFASEPLKDGTYVFRSAINPNFVIDAAGGKSADRTNVWLYSYNGSYGQYWDVKNLGNGYYSITSGLDINKSFDVYGGGKKNGTNIHLYSSNGSNAQQWIIKNVGYGYYTIISKCNDLAVDVHGGRATDRTNIQMYASNGSAAQKFSVKKINLNILKDGVYTISSKLNSSLVVDFNRELAINSSNIQTGTRDDSNKQKWNVKYLGAGNYSITSVLDSSKSIDVAVAGKKNGTNVQLYANNGGDAQKWLLKYSSDGYYTIISKCNGLAVDVAGGSSAPGTNIQMYSSNSSAAQKFKFEETTVNEEEYQTLVDGYYTFSSKLNKNMVVDVYGANKASGTNVVSNNSTGFASQIWKVTYLNNGYYSIKNLLDESKSLDVYGGNTTNGTNIWLYGYNGSSAQQWRIKKNDDDSYSFISKKSGLVLEIKNGSISEGANIQIGNSTKGNSQKFNATPIKFATLANGRYSIASKNSDKILGLNRGVSFDDASVQIETNSGFDDQKWDVKQLGNGYYSITSALDSNKTLTVANASKVSGANVQVSNGNNSDSQIWFLSSNDDGSYNIFSKNSGLSIGSSSVDKYGINVQTFKNNENDNFVFETPKDINRSQDDINGLYTITSKINSNKVLGLNREVAINSTNVQLETANNMNDQKWFIKDLGNGYYSIKSALNSNKSLDVYGGNTSAGTNVQIYESNGSAAQQWLLRDNGDNTYSIVSKKNGLFIDVSNGDSTDGTNIQLYYDNNSNAQRFVLNKTQMNDTVNTLPDGDGYYIISSVANNNKVLDAAGGGKLNGTNVQLYAQNSSKAQIWHIKHSLDGYYTITIAMNNNVSLDINGGNMTSGSNVQLYKRNNSAAQQWIIRDDGEGNYMIISRNSGLVLEAASDTVSNGTNVRLGESLNKVGQKFKFTKYTGDIIYNGVDVSHFQKEINWNLVSKSGVDFAIIKAGEGTSGYNDGYFLKNARNCTANNIAYGIYWFAIATTEQGAISEADAAVARLNEIKAANIDLPNLNTQVFYDVESPINGGGIANLSKETITKNAKAFCNRIVSHGYTCGIYASTSWLVNKLDAKDLSTNYNIWAAQYFDMSHPNFYDAMSRKPMYGGSLYTASPYKYWQFASDGVINGVTGNVDVNLGYNIFK